MSKTLLGASINPLEVWRIEEHREQKAADAARVESTGSIQQRRILALDFSRPWDFTATEEVEFYLTPNPPRRKDEKPGPKEWTAFTFPVRVAALDGRDYLPTIQMRGE